MASEPSIPLVRLILRAACLALLSLAPAASAAAAPVLVFDHGRVTREQDPFVPPQTGPIPPPPPTPAIARASLSRVQIVLRHMLERHDIEGRSAAEIADDITAAFDKYCTAEAAA